MDSSTCNHLNDDDVDDDDDNNGDDDNGNEDYDDEDEEDIHLSSIDLNINALAARPNYPQLSKPCNYGDDKDEIVKHDDANDINHDDDSEHEVVPHDDNYLT